MKKFLLNFLITGMISLICISLPVLIKRIFPSVSFKLSSNKTILVLGDSHPECAIDDSVFSIAANYSRSAESYLYSYIKLRKFIAANDQIKTVILGFSYYSLSNLQEYWYSRSDAVEDKIPRFMNFMNGEELFDIFRLNPGAFYRAAFGAVSRDLLFVHDINKIGIGGYLHLNRHQLEENLADIKTQKPSLFVLSRLQLKYLDKIIEFCKAKGIHLILMNAPMYNGGGAYYMKDDMYGLYKKRYAGIPFMDYADYKMPDSCYGDANHLNYDGAANFSNYLAEKFHP